MDWVDWMGWDWIHEVGCLWLVAGGRPMAGGREPWAWRCAGSRMDGRHRMGVLPGRVPSAYLAPAAAAAGWNLEGQWTVPMIAAAAPGRAPTTPCRSSVVRFCTPSAALAPQHRAA